MWLRNLLCPQPGHSEFPLLFLVPRSHSFSGCPRLGREPFLRWTHASWVHRPGEQGRGGCRRLHVEGRVSSSPRPGLALLRGHSSAPQTLASWLIFLFSELPSPLQPGPNTQPSSGLTRLTHLSSPAEQALFLTYPLCGSQHRHERPRAEKM